LGPGSVGIARGAPVTPGTPPLDPRDDRIQRKAIRGGPVDLSRESQELRELREFEQATFPRAGMRAITPADGSVPGVGPGVMNTPGSADEERGGRLGPDAVPEALRSPAQRRPTVDPAPPTLPWLASLRLLDNLGLSAAFVRFEAHVIKYLEFYKEDRRGRSIMASWLRRQGRYRALIEEALDRHHLPRFLLYVSMIESGYDPHDRSTAGAVGLWQFLPEGARIYGLRVDYWVDERKDPVRATDAAARYLGDLKARFGSWHLALAAFNAGYGAVLRAMQKYNTNDYWELCRHEDGLPWETVLYVPKAIATALVGENRSLFGYDELQEDPAIRYDTVSVTTTVSLAAAARAAGVPQEEVERLNPELRRGRTPPLPPGGTWPLRLPRGSGARFLASYDASKERLESYVVRFGERLDDIARARGISTGELRRINGVEESSEVRAGVTLLVPPLAAGARKAPLPGEEVVIVAVPDKNLVVPGRKRVFYRVIPGDTISAIARFFKVTQGELARWNNLDLEATLATKMVLDVWVNKDFDTSQVALVDPARVRVVTTGSDEFFDLVETLRGRKRVIYLCRAGDTMQKVAKKYGLTAADLERINRLSKSTVLQPGQSLMVYVQMSERERAEALRKLVPGGASGGSVVVTPIEDGEEAEGEDAALSVPAAKEKEPIKEKEPPAAKEKEPIKEKPAAPQAVKEKEPPRRKDGLPPPPVVLPEDG
jgi:membrane-bound lytic murein transglycosylase D